MKHVPAAWLNHLPHLASLPIFATLLIFAPALGRTEPQQPLLHEIFKDHAVLQRDRPIPLWGDSVAGDRVTLTIATKKPS